MAPPASAEPGRHSMPAPGRCKCTKSQTQSQIPNPKPQEVASRAPGSWSWILEVEGSRRGDDNTRARFEALREHVLGGRKISIPKSSERNSVRCPADVDPIRFPSAARPVLRRRPSPRSHRQHSLSIVARLGLEGLARSVTRHGVRNRARRRSLTCIGRLAPTAFRCAPERSLRAR